MKEFANTHYDADSVSVIVPVYNSEKYLHNCIESIRNQSYKNFELILINDGSTDKSGEICNQYALRDNRIRVIHAKNNGPAAARNIGIENSKGEFIFFIDSDDFIENDALNLLIKSFRQHKADIIIGDFRKIKKGIVENRNDISFSGNKLLTKQDIIDYSRSYLKKPNKYLLFAFSWGRLFKSSIIKTNNIFFNPDLHTFEDVAFNFYYLTYTNEVYFLKETIYSHTIYDNYLSATMTISDNPKKLFGYEQALVSISNFLQNNIADAEIKKEIGHAYIYLTIIQLVRACGQINNNNKKNIFQLIQKLVNDSNLRDNLKFYSPSKGDSRILPLLMKLKLIWPILLICRHKAYKRYRKHGKEGDIK
jgi:glycosyltransferase involved in cell wall biosynthesis